MYDTQKTQVFVLRPTPIKLYYEDQITVKDINYTVYPRLVK